MAMSVLGVIKNFALRLVKLVVQLIKAIFNYMLVILKRSHNIFELSILKLHLKVHVQFSNRGKYELCLVQYHQPRHKERLRFKDRKKVEDNDKGMWDDTSHWVVEEFDNHP